jgi:hypothetical protein
MAREEAKRENSARLAFSFGTFQTTGSGTTLFEQVVEFDCQYVRRPYVSYSFAVADGDVQQVPVCSGGVYEWKKNEHGFYIGAWCCASVSYFGTTALTIDHDFTFGNIGMKNIPYSDMV